ncbi:hypothetical protein [Lutimonas zeaxanthinifaciens]|uniref:hypothetical protein n=1 Tax=Lutimonas zeaxanthinifaciens TaxID=3060215 RepID=UPI00265CD538|nr:hypothetical protein [Lutimonas sp. YSD2104]WKK65246.1 hypothetical protein QZH61_11715 [Lutimonas sp. YSD2104]
MLKYHFLVLIFFCSIYSVFAQENWMMKGYVKGMTTMQTIGDDGEIAIENLIHNRFDINWYISDNFTFTAGLRNRIIIGNNVTLIPGYADYVSRDFGYLDLSWVWADNTSWIGLSQLDRFMLDYTAGNFQITLGRQRINWGQTFVWNPNDLFNTYSYFDFDYEEKPGSDALRLQYYLGESSKLELSTSLNSESELTSVLLYRFNTRGYDIQFLGGMYTQTDYILGGGFSGSIAGGGFSGEFTYFHPMEDDNEGGKATATIHYDYTFKSSLNLQFETLYNGFGAENFESGIADIIFLDLSPKNLFPTRLAFFGSGAYDVSPLFRVMLAGMYGPEGSFLYVGPTLTYSISNSMELAGIGQYYSMDEVEDSDGNALVNTGTAIFVRFKWSF